MSRQESAGLVLPPSGLVGKSPANFGSDVRVRVITCLLKQCKLVIFRFRLFFYFRSLAATAEEDRKEPADPKFVSGLDRDECVDESEVAGVGGRVGGGSQLPHSPGLCGVLSTPWQQMLALLQSVHMSD